MILSEMTVLERSAPACFSARTRLSCRQAHLGSGYCSTFCFRHRVSVESGISEIEAVVRARRKGKTAKEAARILRFRQQTNFNADQAGRAMTTRYLHRSISCSLLHFEPC